MSAPLILKVRKRLITDTEISTIAWRKIKSKIMGTTKIEI